MKDSASIFLHGACTGFVFGLSLLGAFAWFSLFKPPAKPAILCSVPTTYFDSTEWVCASNDYAPETWLRVEFQGRVIEVRVSGAGPFRDGQPVHGAIDLSQPAFAALAPIRDGRIAVTVTKMEGGEP